MSTTEATVTTPIPSVVTVTATTTIIVTPSSTCTPGLAAVTPAAQAAGSRQVISVAIPVALATIIVVVIVVLVGIGICVKARGQSKLLTGGRGISFSSSSATAADTHYVNTGTTLRGAQIADSNIDSSRERATTIKEVENELYQLRYKF